MRLRNDNALIRLAPEKPTAAGLIIARPERVPCSCGLKGNSKCQFCHGSGWMFDKSWHEELVEAEVLDVGPGRRTSKDALVPMTIAPGDTVLVYPLCGDYFGDDRKMRLIREEEVQAVLG